MTVAQLIAQLKQLPPNAEIYVWNTDDDAPQNDVYITQHVQSGSAPAPGFLLSDRPF